MKLPSLVVALGLAFTATVFYIPSAFAQAPASAIPSGLYTACGNASGGQLLITASSTGVSQKLRQSSTFPWFTILGSKVLSPTQLAALNQQWWVAGNAVWAAESSGKVYTVVFASGTQPVDIKLSAVRPDIVIHHDDFNTDYCRTPSSPV